MPSAAILAGGRATRFGGRDKSALLVDGRTILSRQLEELAQIADDIMVVGRAGITPDEIEGRPQGGAVGWRTIADRVPDKGPLAGLDAALAAAHHDLLVVVACDMPFVTAAFLDYLLSLAADVDVDAIVPRTEDGYHPLCAVYTRACTPHIDQRLASGRLSMAGLLDELRVRVVTLEEIDACGGSRLLANLNTPAAFDDIGALHSHQA